jgi:hypothetical protein
MDISKLKAAIQKIGVFKSYSSLVVPVAVGLLGVLLFIPAKLWSRGLVRQIKETSIMDGGDRVERLLRSTIAQSQLDEKRKHLDAQGRDANDILLLVKQGTQRQLLSDKIFPEPTDKSVLIFDEFGQGFCDAVRELITRLSAGECPTKAEIESSSKKGAGSRREKLSYRYDIKLKGVVTAAIIDALCREKAEAASVYANPANLGGYEHWQEYKYSGWKKAIEDCWYSQLGYWIIEDVVDTIDVLNSGSDSVYTSEVKRLLSVSFVRKKGGVRRVTASSTREDRDDDLPRYVFSKKDGLAEPCTGRMTDDKDDIDIVHFDVVVVVDTRAISRFMRELCSAKEHEFKGWGGEQPESVNSLGYKHNQITILEYKIASVGTGAAAHEHYRYGEDAVAELHLTCEYVFSKSGYEKIKPDVVKEAIAELLKKRAEEEARSKKRGLRSGASTTAPGINMPSQKDLLD